LSQANERKLCRAQETTYVAARSKGYLYYTLNILQTHSGYHGKDTTVYYYCRYRSICLL